MPAPSWQSSIVQISPNGFNYAYAFSENFIWQPFLCILYYSVNTENFLLLSGLIEFPNSHGLTTCKFTCLVKLGWEIFSLMLMIYGTMFPLFALLTCCAFLPSCVFVAPFLANILSSSSLVESDSSSDLSSFLDFVLEVCYTYTNYIYYLTQIHNCCEFWTMSTACGAKHKSGQLHTVTPIIRKQGRSPQPIILAEVTQHITWSHNNRRFAHIP